MPSSVKKFSYFFIFLALILFSTPTLAALNKLTAINFSGSGENIAVLSFKNEKSPDFEILENIPRKIITIKFRNSSPAELKKRYFFPHELLNGAEILKVSPKEFWVKINLNKNNLKFEILPRQKNSRYLKLRFTAKASAPKTPVLANQLTNLTLTKNQANDRLVLSFNRRPQTPDFSVIENPDFSLRIRVFNTSLGNTLNKSNFSTDLIKSIKFEQENKYLNIFITPNKGQLKLISKSFRRNPASWQYIIGGGIGLSTETSDASDDKDEAKKIALQEEAFLKTKLSEAEELFMRGKYSDAALAFKNIYNYAPKKKTGVDAYFRAADSYFQRQLGSELVNGYNFVIHEYINAINSAIDIDYNPPQLPLAYYNIARGYQKLEFFSEALNNYHIVLKDHPDSPYAKDSLFQSGIVQFNSNQYSKALQLFEQFIRENPKARQIPIAFYKIAESYYHQSDYKMAMENFDIARTRDSEYLKKNPKIMFHMGETYYENKDYRTAREIYEQLLDLYPKEDFSNLVAIRIGDFLKEEGKEDDAIAAYKQAINRYPKELRLIGNMRVANLLSEKPEGDNYQEAIKIYNFIINKNPLSEQVEEALLRKGLTQSLFKQHEEAVKTLELFQLRYPNSPYVKDGTVAYRIIEVINQRINELYIKGKYFDTLSVFETYQPKYFKKLDGKAPLFLIGDSYQKLGLMKQALAIYHKIIKEEGDKMSPLSIYMMGKIYQHRGETEKAAEAYLKFIRLYKNDVYAPEVRKKLGELYSDSHDYQKALEVYQKLIIAPYTGSSNFYEYEILPATYYDMAKLYHTVGNGEKAIEAYKNTLKTYRHPFIGEHIAPYIEETHYSLAKEYYEQKMYPEALKAYREAIRIYPKSDQMPWAKYDIATILQNDKKYNQALKIYDELIEQATKTPGAIWGTLARENREDLIKKLRFDKYLESEAPTGAM